MPSFSFLSGLTDRRISFIYIGFIAIAALSSYYAFRSFLEGSPVILLGLAYVGILVSLRTGHDEVAGALMLFSAFQWEIGGLFLLFTTLWVFWERRWRVFAGAGMLAFVLLVLSFFWYPGWFMPFLRASWNSFRVGVGFSTHDLFVQLWPQFGDILGWVLTAVLGITLFYEWRAARQEHFNHFIWVVCLTLAATPLMGYHVEMDHLFPLTLPIMFIVLVSRERWKRFGDGIAFLLLWFFFGLPWLLFLGDAPQWINLDKEEILFLFWPVFTVLGLFWVRWWMIRAPRTWLDHFDQRERG